MSDGCAGLGPTGTERSISAGDLEARLSQYLGLPASEPNERDKSVSASIARLALVRNALQALRQEAGRVGQIPANYPRHVHIVMKVISALLPWYTRPISRFAHTTTETVETILDALEQIARKQEKLEARLRAYDQSNPEAPTRPLGRNPN